MKIGSFDVGIRTFNFCIQEIVKCDLSFIKQEIINAKNKIESSSTCLKEMIMDYQRINNYIKNVGKSKIKMTKWVLTDLFPLPEELTNLGCISCNRKAKYYNKKCGEVKGYCTRHKIPKVKEIKIRNVKKISVFEIDKALIKEIRKYPEVLECDEIIIEKQAGKFSARIGRVESFLYHHFMDNGVLNEESNIKRVKIIHAKNKLRVKYDGPVINCNHLKRKYDRRKYKGVEMMKYFLHKDNDYKNIEILNKTKKKDDLCDNALMCRYHITVNLKEQLH